MYCATSTLSHQPPTSVSLVKAANKKSHASCWCSKATACLLGNVAHLLYQCRVHWDCLDCQYHPCWMLSFVCQWRHHHHRLHPPIRPERHECAQSAGPVWTHPQSCQQLAYLMALGRPVGLFWQGQWFFELTTLDQPPSTWNLDTWPWSVDCLRSTVLRAIVHWLEREPAFSAVESKVCQRSCNAEALDSGGCHLSLAVECAVVSSSLGTGLAGSGDSLINSTPGLQGSEAPKDMLKFPVGISWASSSESSGPSAIVWTSSLQARLGSAGRRRSTARSQTDPA